MTRFKKETSNLRKAIALKNTGIITDDFIQQTSDVEDIKSSSLPSTPANLKRHRSWNVLSKLSSRLSLVRNRYMLFSSPEYLDPQNRIIPSKDDPSVNSPVGKLVTSIDPSIRTRTLGDLWLYSDGLTKEEMRNVLMIEAETSYKKDKKLQEYSLPKSPLRNSIPASITFENSDMKSKLRRSKRIASRVQKPSH